MARRPIRMARTGNDIVAAAGSGETGSEVRRLVADVEPSSFFRFFIDICAIPRASYCEKAISDYVVAFAKRHGLLVVQDGVYNVIVKKKGSKGFEHSEPVILHGHLDMVCWSDPGVNHDFQSEGIKFIREGNFLRAAGTTLGADNGVGIAMALSLLECNTIVHPPLEVVLTAREEAAKEGAKYLDTAILQGRRLIDFNWRDDESVFAGCAGDSSIWLNIPVRWEIVLGDFSAMTLSVHGLQGGHSLYDADLERGNALAVLGRLLREIAAVQGVRLANLFGGVSRYVIPTTAEAMLFVMPEKLVEVTQLIQTLGAEIISEYDLREPNMQIELQPCRGDFSTLMRSAIKIYAEWSMRWCSFRTECSTEV